MRRREAREPVAYILGRREFRRLTLAVDRRVLIPRPETELLVEVGLELPAGAAVVDVGTGSGAVALALTDERPDLVVRGLDVSADALEVARANARAARARRSSSRAPTCSTARGYDAVLANLPYVADGAELAPEIARVRAAGGAVRRCGRARRWSGRLVARGGERRPARCRCWRSRSGPSRPRRSASCWPGWASARSTVRRDLAGHERVVVGRA